MFETLQQILVGQQVGNVPYNLSTQYTFIDFRTQ